MLSRNLLKSGVVSTMAALSAFLGNIMLARYLSHDVYGRLALVITVFNLISVVSAFGQPALIKRKILQTGILLNWKNDVLWFLLINTSIAVLLTFLTSGWYEFTSGEMLFIIYFSIGTASISYGVVLLDCANEFVVSSLIQRLPIGLVLLLAPLFLYGTTLSFYQILFIVGFFFLFTLILTTWKLRDFNGSLLIKRGERKLGLHLVMLSLTNLLPFYGISAVAGKIAPTESFAIFSAAMLFQRPFYILNNLLNRILAITWKDNRKSTIKDYLYMIALSSGFTVFCILFKEEVVQFIFGPGFQEGAIYITPFMLTGLFVIIDTLPRNYLLNFSSKQVVKWFTGTQVFVAVSLIVYSQFAGLSIDQVAWVGFILLALKVTISFIFLWVKSIKN